MKNYEIWDIMTKDHFKLATLLGDVKGKLDGDFESIRDSFNIFKWELEKHFFTEEKAISIFYVPHDPMDKNIIPDLLNDHDKILKKLALFEEKLPSISTEHFMEFEIMLMKHKSYEEESLYPKLDQGLDEMSKKLIIDRISNPI